MADFDSFIDRRNTGACKWEPFRDIYGDGDMIPMTVADMEMPTAEPIRRALIKAAQHGLCGYTEPDKIYVDALSGFLSRRHGLCVTKDNLVCTSGIVPAFGILIRALTNSGDTIILQPPVYTPFFDAIRGNDRNIAENPLILDNGTYRMDYEGLEKLCESGAKLLMLCSPHNPVGRVWTEDELKRAGEICRRYNVIIICDEIHNDIVFGRRHTSLATLDGMKDITITCTAMSKTFNLAGLMLSNIVIYNKDIYDKVYMQVGKDGSYCIPYFGRAAAIAAFTECDEWIDGLNSHIKVSFEICRNFFENNIPAVKPVKAEGTYLMWLDVRALNACEDELLRRFRDAKIPVCGGKSFGTGGEGFIRINIALPRRELMIALERMKKVLY